MFYMYNPNTVYNLYFQRLLKDFLITPKKLFIQKKKTPKTLFFAKKHSLKMLMTEPLERKIQPLSIISKCKRVILVCYPGIINTNPKGSRNNVLHVSHNMATNINNQTKIINPLVIQSNQPWPILIVYCRTII